ncbi:MAG: hypothetical protein KDA85_09060 [Planctomycetaceae bacterium]|nr:hypothetical protein [Planctomycetaceae bacterium]
MIEVQSLIKLIKRFDSSDYSGDEEEIAILKDLAATELAKLPSILDERDLGAFQENLARTPGGLTIKDDFSWFVFQCILDESISRLQLEGGAVVLSEVFGNELPDWSSSSGCRTKLGGMPTYETGAKPLPTCDRCRSAMVFIAQIDSICGADIPGKDVSGFDFVDGGMIYVFWCFECGIPAVAFECH